MRRRHLLDEAGVPGHEAYTFSLIAGPAGMPQNVIDALDKASRQAMADPATPSSSRAMPPFRRPTPRPSARRSSSKTSSPSRRR